MRESVDPVADLRSWLEKVESSGSLLKISHPVDPIEEMSALTYLVAKAEESPAVLFDHAAGPLGVRQLWNIYGPSVARTAITLEEQPDIAILDLIRATKEKLKRRISANHVPHAQAPIFQNSVLGDQIDLNLLPIPRHWPGDGGLYAGTADAVFTRDPDTGIMNVGTYRMMLQGPRHVGLCMAPGKDALAHMHRAWQRGESLKIAAAWGMDPLLMVVGSQNFPRDVSEYECAGGIKGKAIDVTTAIHSDLCIPAFAEIIIEGEIPPNSVKKEGPFGEFTGYYGLVEENCPLLNVTALHHRDSPILTNALMSDYPSSEQGAFFSVIRSARIWNDLDSLGLVGVQGVYSHPAAAGGFGLVVISINQRYAGHAAQALALAGQVPSGAYITKWIIAVDEDVDPTDMDQVFWAMATRSNPADDIDILRNTRGSPLDPAQYPPERRLFGSKALINACKDYRSIKSFPERTLLRRSVYERAVEHWKISGIPGHPPRITLFDSER